MLLHASCPFHLQFGKLVSLSFSLFDVKRRQHRVGKRVRPCLLIWIGMKLVQYSTVSYQIKLEKFIGLNIELEFLPIK